MIQTCKRNRIAVLERNELSLIGIVLPALYTHIILSMHLTVIGSALLFSRQPDSRLYLFDEKKLVSGKAPSIETLSQNWVIDSLIFQEKKERQRIFPICRWALDITRCFPWPRLYHNSEQVQSPLSFWIWFASFFFFSLSFTMHLAIGLTAIYIVSRQIISMPHFKICNSTFEKELFALIQLSLLCPQLFSMKDKWRIFLFDR